jgi:hypothetical protein
LGLKPAERLAGREAAVDLHSPRLALEENEIWRQSGKLALRRRSVFAELGRCELLPAAVGVGIELETAVGSFGVEERQADVDSATGRAVAGNLIVAAGRRQAARERRHGGQDANAVAITRRLVRTPAQEREGRQE